MKGYKELLFANFNCTFGENEKFLLPMLTQFKEVIFPAFFDSRINKNFYFYDIKLHEHQTHGLYISGRIVRDTILEIKSRFNHDNRTLEETDEKYSSSPYSEFILLLSNHRLIFVKGQKGSPTLSNMNALIKHNIKKAVRDYNNRCETGKEISPLYELTILEIPKQENIISKIKDFKNISKFALKFFALNNDVFDENFYNNFQNMRKESGSKSLVSTFNHPEKKEFIAKLIEKNDGLAEFSMTATEKDGTTRHYKNEDFKESVKLVFPEHETVIENENLAINTALKDSRMNIVSIENGRIYNKFKDIIAILKKI